MRVGVLGPRGVIGQQYVRLLEDHPWFTLAYSGPPALSEEVLSCDLLFSALRGEDAAIWEPRLVQKGKCVISSAQTHRLEPLVPLIIPEVNRDHLHLIDRQPWEGALIAKPNCSLQSFVIPLTPLRSFGIEKISLTSLQAISGAGYRGLSAMEIQDNVIPHIPGEEEKTEQEPKKIWGKRNEERLRLDEVTISAHCHRVPVLEGHLASLSVSFASSPTREQILAAWEAFAPLPLPSSPKRVITYREEVDRPQPRLDRDNSMGITVGRLRPCSVLDWRFVALSHNTIRGGAGGGILIAETLSLEDGPTKSPFCKAQEELPLR